MIYEPVVLEETGQEEFESLKRYSEFTRFHKALVASSVGHLVKGTPPHITCTCICTCISYVYMNIYVLYFYI